MSIIRQTLEAQTYLQHFKLMDPDEFILLFGGSHKVMKHESCIFVAPCLDCDIQYCLGFL